MLTKRRPSILRLLALVVGFAIAHGTMPSTARVAPIRGLKQFPVPTPNSLPRYITPGSHGNLWFTEGNPSFPDPPNVGRIAPPVDITEFPVCLDGCPATSWEGRATYSTSPIATSRSPLIIYILE